MMQCDASGEMDSWTMPPKMEHRRVSAQDHRRTDTIPERVEGRDCAVSCPYQPSFKPRRADWFTVDLI